MIIVAVLLIIIVKWVIELWLTERVNGLSRNIGKVGDVVIKLDDIDMCEILYSDIDYIIDGKYIIIDRDNIGKLKSKCISYIVIGEVL